MKTKVCTKCGEEKKLSEFSVKTAAKSGRMSQCRKCRSAAYKARTESTVSVRRRSRNDPKPRTKTCTKCGDEKRLGGFQKDNRTVLGVTSWCRQCIAKKRKAHHARYRDRTEAAPEKLCPHCRTTKPKSGFYEVSVSSTGLSPYCKSCNSKLAKIRYPFRAKAWTKAYTDANRDAINARRRERRAAKKAEALQAQEQIAQ